MSLAPSLLRDLPADLDAQRYELARARQLARAWAETLIAALPAAEPAIVLRQIGTRLNGLELDSYAASFGQNAIELLLADVTTAAGRPAPIVVRVADTLEEAPSARFDLVTGIPHMGASLSVCPPPPRNRGLRRASRVIAP